MTWVAAAVIGAQVVGSIVASDAQQSAADTAANSQIQASQMGVDEQRRQFDRLQALLNPFVQAATGVPLTPLASTGALATGPGGTAAPRVETADQIRSRLLSQFTTQGAGGGMTFVPNDITGGSWVPAGPGGANVNEQGLSAAVQAELQRQQQAAAAAAGPAATPPPPGTGYMLPGGGGSLRAQQDLTGLNGAAAQQAAIDQLQKLPGFTSQLKIGENRLLQNASATGGLRGGNTEAALALFAPQLLAQTINDQYGRLGGITSLGQNAAAMVGNAGMQTGLGVAGLLQQGGAAAAGAALAGGRAQAGLYSNLGGALGQFVGGGGRFGGIPTPDALQASFAQTPAGSAGFGTGAAYGNQDIGLFL